jgi:hypothetical protein
MSFFDYAGSILCRRAVGLPKMEAAVIPATQPPTFPPRRELIGAA